MSTPTTHAAPTLVVVEAHGSVSLVVLDSRGVRTVDGNLQIVGAQTVQVRVVVREETTLQHFVRARFDAYQQQTL